MAILQLLKRINDGLELLDSQSNHSEEPYPDSDSNEFSTTAKIIRIEKIEKPLFYDANSETKVMRVKKIKKQSYDASSEPCILRDSFSPAGRKKPKVTRKFPPKPEQQWDVLVKSDVSSVLDSFVSVVLDNAHLAATNVCQ